MSKVGAQRHAEMEKETSSPVQHLPVVNEYSSTHPQSVTTSPEKQPYEQVVQASPVVATPLTTTSSETSSPLPSPHTSASSEKVVHLSEKPPISTIPSNVHGNVKSDKADTMSDISEDNDNSSVSSSRR